LPLAGNLEKVDTSAGKRCSMGTNGCAACTAAGAAGPLELTSAAAELPAAELSAAELPAAELPAAELPAAELPAAFKTARMGKVFLGRRCT